MKNVFKIGLAMVLFLSLVGCGCDKNPGDKTENNTNNESKVENTGSVLPNKTVKGVEITDASVAYVDGVSTIVATVKNTNKTAKKITTVKIKLLDADGNVVHETEGYIGNTLKNGETQQIKTTVSKDLSSAKDVKYSLN